MENKFRAQKSGQLIIRPDLFWVDDEAAVYRWSQRIVIIRSKHRQTVICPHTRLSHKR